LAFVNPSGAFVNPSGAFVNPSGAPLGMLVSKLACWMAKPTSKGIQINCFWYLKIPEVPKICALA